MGFQGGKVQEPKAQSLARQGSLYSLTLDEVQNQLGDLGKPLGSMNLDELLKTVWTNEDNAAVQPDQSLTLSRDLSKKTVDEVWKDIQRKDFNREKKFPDTQPTFGEMTLEDFLLKAGIVSESESPTGDVLGINHLPEPQLHVAHHAQWMHYQLPTVQPQQQQNVMTVFMSGQPLPLGANLVMDAAYPEIVAPSETQTPGWKRAPPEEVVEKTFERRQKRMIKNRESAARSRARKQAYTNELENKISRLEEENERLRKQQEVDTMLPCPPPEPNHHIRRTGSAPF